MTSEAPPKPRTRADQIATLLREQIVRYDLRPGDRIIESEVADRFGVSRTPVREALRRLQEAGLIITNGRGCYVRQFDLVEMNELWAVREALETLAIRTLATSLTPDKLRELQNVCAAFPTDADPTLTTTHDEAFHETIARLSGNSVLTTFIREMHERIHIIRMIDFTDQTRVSLTRIEHERVVTALQSGRYADAEERLRDNIREAGANIQRLASEGLARVYLQRERL